MHIGKEGVTEAAEEAVHEAFNTRELLKVRVLDNAPQGVRGVGQEIAERLEDVHIVQVIGGILVLYRTHPERPEIELPR